MDAILTPDCRDSLEKQKQTIIAALPAMAEQANRGCGLVYELYIQRISTAIDHAIAGLPLSIQEEIRQVARDTVDYFTPEELAKQNAMLEEEGLCQHGLDADTCPCGCFEYDDYKEDDPDDVEPSPQASSWKDKVDFLALQAKREILELALDAMAVFVEDAEFPALHSFYQEKINLIDEMISAEYWMFEG